MVGGIASNARCLAIGFIKCITNLNYYVEKDKFGSESGYPYHLSIGIQYVEQDKASSRK